MEEGAWNSKAFDAALPASKLWNERECYYRENVRNLILKRFWYCFFYQKMVTLSMVKYRKIYKRPTHYNEVTLHSSIICNQQDKNKYSPCTLLQIEVEQSTKSDHNYRFLPWHQLCLFFIEANDERNKFKSQLSYGTWRKEEDDSLGLPRK